MKEIPNLSYYLFKICYKIFCYISDKLTKTVLTTTKRYGILITTQKHKRPKEGGAKHVNNT